MGVTLFLCEIAKTPCERDGETRAHSRKEGMHVSKRSDVGIILKKSARKDQRVSARVKCVARSVETGHTVAVQMNDLSLGGMSFFSSQPSFDVKSEIEIQFKDSKSRFFVVQGRIVGVLRDRRNVYRHAVEFRRRLTESQMTTLLEIVPIDRFVKSA